tara:strand:+ start:1834 stop:2049 length:216 start_codon:yes stop_codon:yes gene_type:complete
MIPFKYKGYNIKINGTIQSRTSVKISNYVEDHLYIFSIRTEQEKLFANLINRIKKTVDDLIRLKQQTEANA